MIHTAIYESAYVPDLPGIVSVGDSREKGLPTPEPSSFAGSIEVKAA